MSDTVVPSQLSSGMSSSGPLSTWSTRLLLAGLVAGAAGDYLLWSGLFRSERLNGAGLPAWIFLLGVAALFLNAETERKWRNTVMLWSLTGVLASTMLIWRDSYALIPLMLLVLLAALGTLTLQSIRGTVVQVRLIEMRAVIGKVLANIFLGTAGVLLKINLRDSLANYRWQGYVRGLMVALPLLFVFSILFANADARFDGYMESLTDMFSLSAPRHILIILFMGWFSAGLLLCSRRQDIAIEKTRDQSPRRQLGGEETSIIMGSLAALFVCFVILQLGYLFGGQATIQEVGGLTLSEYARRGFFELLAVAALTLVVLMFMSGTNCVVRIFRPLAYVLVFCVLIILASAVQRLLLYIDEYGFTLARMTALAVMAWLAFNLVAFTFTLLRGRTAWVAAMLVFSGMITLLGYAMLNPVAIVTRINIDRTIATSKALDTEYLLALGADAVPETLKNLDLLSLQTQCSVARSLLNQWSLQNSKWVGEDWRHWNYSRARARELVSQRRGVLQGLVDRADKETLLQGSLAFGGGCWRR